MQELRLIPKTETRRRGVKIDGQPYVVEQARSVRAAAEQACRNWLQDFGFGHVFHPSLTPTDFGGFLLNLPGGDQAVVEVFSS